MLGAKKAQVEKTDGLDNKALKIAIVKALRGDSVDFEGRRMITSMPIMTVSKMI